MTGTSARLSSAAAQTVAGVAAHTAAAGCLPGTGALVLTLPTAGALVLVLLRLVPDRPLLRLAGAQLTVHALLTLSACAGAGHAEVVSGAPSVVMTFAHVGALVLCRAVLGAVVRGAEAAVARLRSCLRPVSGAGLRPAPAWPVTTVRRTACRRGAKVHRRAPRRGPPVGPRLLPA